MTTTKLVTRRKKVNSSKNRTSFSIPTTPSKRKIYKKKHLECIEPNPTGSLSHLTNLNIGGISELPGNKHIEKTLVYTIDVSPDIAREILSVGGSYHNIQRNTRYVTINQYADEMKKNRWESFEVLGIGFDKEDSLWATLNGKTRLSAVILSGKTIRFTIMEKHIYTSRHTHDLYANFDNGRLRKVVDASGCYGINESVGQVRRNMNAIHRAVRFIEMGFNYTSTNHNSLRHTRRNAAEVKLYTKESIKLYKMINGSPYKNRFSTKGNFVGPCMAIIRDNPRLGTKFVRAIVTGDGFTYGDPRKFVHDLFVNDKKYKERTLQQTMNAIFSCWNMWIRKEKIITFQKPTAFKMPDNILKVDVEKQQREALASYDKEFGDLDYSYSKK